MRAFHVLQKSSAVKLFAIFLVYLMLGVGCAGPKPLEELVLARVALEAAKDSGASTITPGLWHKAEEEYRKGQKAMQGNYNQDAKEFFDRARVFAEKAENATRLKKFTSGDGFI